ncbi:MAG: energy transducer TonB [Acidobacteria bacterium]|nr:energy transducer TonB [Acidobacteriota bacterium]
MARDLFGDVTRPFSGAGARSRLTVPLSIAAHTTAVVAIVVVPLLATDALPALHSRVEYSVITPLLPPEPPRPRIARAPEPPMANPDAAPLVTPDRITEEPAWQRDPISTIDAGAGIINGLERGADLLAPPPPPPPPSPPGPKGPVVVGGRVTAPARTSYVAPVYPAIAQAARVQGLVVIQATIGTDGAVVDATVLRSVPLLDQAALTAVRQWRYTPTRLNGEVVAVIMTVTVNFELR